MDTQGLAQYTEKVYKATDGLMRMAPEDKMGWRPSETGDWMSMGQLLHHLTDATGMGMNGFITGEWPEMPEGAVVLPGVEQMPSVSSIAEACEKLDTDRRLAAKLFAQLSEEDFRNRMVAAPWLPTPLPLCTQLLLMVEHQISHKTMLFMYLKMLGLEVDTGSLYGMG